MIGGQSHNSRSAPSIRSLPEMGKELGWGLGVQTLGQPGCIHFELQPTRLSGDGIKQMASNLCLALGSGRRRQTHNSAHSGAHKRGRERRASTAPRAGRQARCSTDGAPGNPGQGPGVSVPVSSLQMLKRRLRGAPWGARGRVASKWEGKGPHSAFSAGNTTHVTDKRDGGASGSWGGQGRRVSGW